MSIGAWLALIALCAVAAMTPGASLLVILRHAVAGGRRPGLAAAAAHATGISLYAGGTVAGLAVVLSRWPTVERLLALAGAVYLAALGLRSLRDARRPSGSAAPSTRVEDGGSGPALRDGFMVAVTNPKVAAFFLALFAPFTSGKTSASALTLLVAIPVAVDGLWYALVALLATRPRAMAWFGRHGAWIHGASGLGLLAFASSIALRAAGAL